MIFLVLSHSHVNLGPRLVTTYPGLPDNILLDHLPFLIDFYDPGFFIHEFGELKTSNFIFTMDTMKPRGQEEIFMISIAFMTEHYDKVVFRGVLRTFWEEFKEIKDVGDIFYETNNQSIFCDQKALKIKNIMKALFNSSLKDYQPPEN